LKLWFAKTLLQNSFSAIDIFNLSPLPTGFPVLVIVGDNKADQYVHTPLVMDWAEYQHKSRGVEMFGIQCKGAYHELDNEDGFPGAPGPSVRAAAAAFAANIAAGLSATPSPGICKSFLE
jgi:hypothetical protein